MFSSLKDKLSNVTIFTSKKKSVEANKKNLKVGFHILQQFEAYWEELHGLNEDNAKNASKIAETVNVLSDKIKADKQNIYLLIHILSNSNLTVNVTNCFNSIKNLQETSEDVEKNLVQLERLIDEIHFENMKKQHQHHLNSYIKRKEGALENFRIVLEENHAKKLSQYEDDKNAEKIERQKAFQAAFKMDIEVYKNLGTLPPHEQKKQDSALLEEIQIDFDQNELDNFFSNST